MKWINLTIAVVMIGLCISLAGVVIRNKQTVKQLEVANHNYTELLKSVDEIENRSAAFKNQRDSLLGSVVINHVTDSITKAQVYFSSTDLDLPKGEVRKIYPPKAAYRDLHKTKLYAVIGDSVLKIVDLNTKQWLMLNLGDKIK